MNKYFIICNAISKIYKCDSWAYLVGWSSVEVDEWESRYPNLADFKNKEDIIESVLNHSQINRPYLFNSLKDAKESLIRIKANDLFEDHDHTYNYYIVNFVPAYLNEVIEI